MSGFDVWDRDETDRDSCLLSARLAVCGLVIPWAGLMALVGGPAGAFLCLLALLLVAAFVWQSTFCANEPAPASARDYQG